MATPDGTQLRILNDLQNMARNLPLNYQQKLPQDFLTDLANSLLDETVFDIVKNLTDIQQMVEKSLFERRMNLVNSHNATKNKVLGRHDMALQNEYLLNPANVECLRLKQSLEIKELEKYNEEELTHLDMNIIMELDQSVSDQQITLQKVGVPGFYLTNKPEDIKLQMYLLEFITNLSAKEGRT